MQTAPSTERQSATAKDRRATAWDYLLSPARQAGGSLLLGGKRILITGAGGSIGSALAAAAAASEPAGLVLLDNSETGLYQVDRNLREAGSHTHVAILGSVCDAVALEQALIEHRPHIIFHAAALKHVPLMELNPFAAVENNVFGTLLLRDLSIAHNVEQLVLVSTDKAVDPCSVMGASKRIAELLLLSTHSVTRLTAVRLCNVMGSQGSVLPLFLDQLAKGVALTVTDPEARRHFITLEEAVHALCNALQHDASPALLLPSVGRAMRIADLARHVLDTHQGKSGIVFTGLRPGDKLIEQLVSNREVLSEQCNAVGLRVITTPSISAGRLSAALQILRDAIQLRDLTVWMRGIVAIVPEYEPSSVITAAIKRAQEPVAEMLV